MAGAFRIAEGFVEVTADETGFNRSMQRLQSRRYAVKVNLQLDDTAALGQLTRFMRERTMRVVADLDDTAATASLTRLTRTRTARITADADTARARTDLDALARDRRVNVRVDLDRSALSRLSGLNIGGLADVGSTAGSVGLLGGRFAMLAGAALTALPAVASLTQSIAAMGPAALVAVPGLLSLGAAFATIKIGTSGIGDAFKAAFAPAVTSGAAAESAARRVADAQRALGRAQQGVKDAEQRAADARVQAARRIEDAQRSLKGTVQDVADANRRAAQQVASAERDLADAQRAARQAQQDLTAARKEAAQELEDLNNRLTDAQLDERQKVLDLQDAEQELAAIKAKGGKAGQEDFDKAQLGYDRALQSLQEQRTETARLQQEAAAANQAGVEGSKTVVTAKQQIADANQDVRDRTQALKDAEIDQARTTEDGLQRIADAERDVADAREAARKAAVDGAKDIADAQEAVADAARAVADAQTSGATATNKLADAMARLAPNAREFVNAVIAQSGAWRGLKLDVQNKLFEGLAQSFTTMSAAILPDLKGGLTGTAGVLNTMAKNTASAITELGKTGQIKKLFDGLNQGLSPLTRVPGQFIKGLTQIGIAASPAFKRINTAAGGFFDRISQQIDTAAKNGHLEKIIDRALEIAKQFGKVIGDAFGTLGNLMKAAGDAGGNALGALGSVFAELRRVTAMPEVQKSLTTIFKALADVGKLLAGTLGAVLQAALPLLASLAPVVSDLARRFAPLLVTLADTLGKALAPIITALLPVVSTLGDILDRVVRSLMPLLQPIGNLLGAVITALAPVLDVVGDVLVMLVGALVKGLKPVIAALIPAVKMFGQFIAQLAPKLLPVYAAVMPLIPVLGQMASTLIHLAMNVIGPLLPLVVKLAGVMSTALAGAIGFLVPKITTVIGWFQKFADKASEVVNAVVGFFQDLYDKLVGHSIIPDLVNAIIGWFTSLWTNTKQLFTDLKNGVVQIWKDLWTSLTTKWNTFWTGLKTAITNAWTSVKTMFTGLKTTISNTWNTMWNGLSSKVTGIFSTISTKIGTFKSGMKTAFSNLKNELGTVWDGVKSKISSPIKWVIDKVYNQGIRKMWNTIAGKVASKLTLPAISLGFNTGGVVPGTGNRDTVPAMLTPGERILSTAQVAKLGGHRAIDAMLGQDRPTKTGGNPTPAQERKQHQPVPGYAEGGIIGSVTSAIGGAVSSAASWAKDLVIGGLKAAAQKAIAALVRPLIDRIPGGGVGSLMKSLSNRALDSMLGFLGAEDKKAVGGPAVQKALAWARTQDGKPYQWGGNGNPSFDCSGLVSAIESVIRGEKPHRRWATGAFSGTSGPPGWVRNLNSPFMIGITNAGVGHTAGTLAGVNVESRGGDGIVIGKRARGYNDPLFTSRWGFAPAAKYDEGGLLQPGATLAVNRTGKPEAVLTAEEHAAFRSLARHGGGTTVQVSMTVNSLTMPSPSERKQFAKGMAEDIKEALRQLDRSRA